MSRSLLSLQSQISISYGDLLIKVICKRSSITTKQVVNKPTPVKLNASAQESCLHTTTVSTAGQSQEVTLHAVMDFTALIIFLFCPEGLFTSHRIM